LGGGEEEIEVEIAPVFSVMAKRGKGETQSEIVMPVSNGNPGYRCLSGREGGGEKRGAKDRSLIIIPSRSKKRKGEKGGGGGFKLTPYGG